VEVALKKAIRIEAVGVAPYGTVKIAPLNLSQFVEGRRWWSWAREDLEEVRVFAGDGLCNGEKMVSFSASVYALQSVIN